MSQPFHTSLLSFLKESDFFFIPILVFISTLIVYYEIEYSSIKRKYNLKGPKPWPIIGNLFQFSSYSLLDLSVIWRENYGKMSINFLFDKPNIVIADREVVNQLSGKDFEAMSDHHITEGSLSSSLLQSLFFQPGKRWKETRSLLSPVFTSSKIKRMYKMVDDCSNDLLDCIEEQLNDHLDKYKSLDNFIFQTTKTYELYSINNVATCCYALRLGRKKGDISRSGASRNKMIHHVKSLFQLDFIQSICYSLPLINFLVREPSSESVRFITEQINQVIANRIKDKEKHDDYLQTLIEATEKSAFRNFIIERSNDGSERLEEEQYNESKVKLSHEEFISNALILFIDGLETVGSALSCITYCLAHHQDIQRRLYESVSKIASKSNDIYKFDYNELSACEYLNAVISETLRLFTPVPMSDRIANYNYTIEKYNTTIRKGAQVLFNLHAIHTDPDNWPEPNKFDPERFMPENKHKILPGSYIPFGQGPRICLAMRFGLIETKLAVAKILMNYKFDKIAKSEFPPLSSPNSGMVVEFECLDVHIRRRDNN